MPQHAAMMAELRAVLEIARHLEREELPRLLGELEEIRVTAWQRLTVPGPAEKKLPASEGELVDVEEAARRLGVSTQFLYRNHKRYSFALKVGNTLRFSPEGIASYIEDSRHKVS